MRKVLMSAANPDGWTLEGLLAQLQIEVKEKDAKLKFDVSDLACAVSKNNRCILGCLEEAEKYQRESYAMLDAKSPNEGPKGKPRIGIDSQEGSDYV